MSISTLRAVLLAAFAIAPAAAHQQAGADESSIVEYGADLAQRMTVPVTIGASGPYRFIVDTGAERTIISRELAERLDLELGARSRVASVTEVSDRATAVIPALEVGGRTIESINAPMMERRHIGAEGMLGVDTLRKKRVSFDFARQEMTVMPSARREENWAGEDIVVTARSRFGYLVLVDAEVDRQKVWVVVDTGSQVTIGNEALRTRLERRRPLRDLKSVRLLSVTGGKADAQQASIKAVRIDRINFHDMPVAFADVYIFRQLDLEDRPALLLGMDVLRMFDRVSVDFETRRVRLLMPETKRG